MRDILDQIIPWWEMGETFGLATVVQTFRSAPRDCGAAMAVSPVADVVGSVSGGCVEGAVYELSGEVIASGQPVLQRYGVSDESAFSIGLTCGGIIDIFVEQVSKNTYPELGDIAAAVRSGRPVAVATVISGPGRIGARRIIWPAPDDLDVPAALGAPASGTSASGTSASGTSASGTSASGTPAAPQVPVTPMALATAVTALGPNIPTTASVPDASQVPATASVPDASHIPAASLGSGDRLDQAVDDDARGMLAQGLTGVRRYGPEGERRRDDLAVFVQSFAPPPTMLVFGAIDFAAAVARIGKFLGYRVIVCDARPVFATASRFPDADEVITDWPHRYLSSVGSDGRTAICVLTHDPKFDVPVLKIALRLPAAYIGAMGSRHTHEDRLRRLREAGLTETELARLRSPVGLDLGARTPEETAVAIAAELIQLRWGGSGQPLTTTGGRIHHD